MEIGIFSRTFGRSTLEGVLDAAAVHGLSRIHFNLRSVGLACLPDELDNALCGRIREAFEIRRCVMTSISATFNTIHPDVNQRETDTLRACCVIHHCRQMGTAIATLCTGTRDPYDMWRQHPDNQGSDAWRDLLATVQRLLQAAENSCVILGVEPEKGNVVDSAAKARRLLDEMRSPYLKIVMDAANLFTGDDLTHMQRTLEEAFDLLGSDMVIAHAKDIAGPAKTDQAAGTGQLDWKTYCRLLTETGFKGPVILHNLKESQIRESVTFLRRHLAEAGGFNALGLDSNLHP
jgi:sugar phosphate isomerase/epimerase